MENIAIITKNFHRAEKDAAITTLINHCKLLKKKGFNPIIITEKGYAGYEGYKRNSPYEFVEGIQVFRPYYISWFRTERWYLNPFCILDRIILPALGVKYVEKKLKISFDIIHNFSGAYPFVLRGYLAKLLSKKAKLVNTIKAYSYFDKYFFSPGSPFWIKLLNLADMVTVPSNEMKRRLLRNGLNKKIMILNSAINTSKFYPKNKEKLKKKYGYQKNIVLLYYGHWGAPKGVHNLIRISPYLKENFPKIIMLLVHPSYLNKKDRELYERYKQIGNLRLIKGKVKIEEYVNLADLVALPYATLKATETNPLCLLESVACKTPVVTTKIRDITEFFTPDKDIVVCKPHDQESLLNAITKILKNNRLQKQITKSAHRKIKKFDIHNQTDNLIKIYSNLLHGGNK